MVNNRRTRRNRKHKNRRQHGGSFAAVVKEALVPIFLLATQKKVQKGNYNLNGMLRKKSTKSHKRRKSQKRRFKKTRRTFRRRRKR